MRLELAWGRVRRAYLKRCRPGYVQRMRACRLAEATGCPHEVLDPRDLKYHRNLTGELWRPQDDPFAWRNRLPFAREGLFELLLFGGVAMVLAALAALWWWPLSVPWLVLAGLVFWFFRDPRRTVPDAPGSIVSPADGKLVEIRTIAADPFLEGPAVQLGIFLSIFNVHVNRAPETCRVIGLTYIRGKFLNALRPESARENEQMVIRLEQVEPPYRRLIVRQISGAIARRIVCNVRPGDIVRRGDRLGMIKFGSRTELLVPASDDLEIVAQVGEKVRAGSTLLARYGQQDR